MRKHPAVGMRAKDLGELYTYLNLFGRVYTDCEEERKTMERGIEDIFMREYGHQDGAAVLQAMWNPREAGRRRKNGDGAREQIRLLAAQGKSIREISAETNIPKSTVHRIKKSL